MEVNQKTIKFKHAADWHYLVPIGDIHLGNKGCQIKHLKDMVKWIKEKDNCHWIGMGDYLDCINYSDKRFDAAEIDQRFFMDNCVPLQLEELIKLLEPIKDKCIGMHRGNHEEKIRLKYHYDIMYELWREWHVPNLKDQALTRLRYVHDVETDGKMPCYTFDIYSTHGRIGGRKGGAKINRLEDMIGETNADVYLMAHSHIKATETKTQRYLDNKCNLRYAKKILAVTGCFLRSAAYAEKGMYPPTDVGVVKIMFNPKTHDIHISE